MSFRFFVGVCAFKAFDVSVLSKALDESECKIYTITFSAKENSLRKHAYPINNRRNVAISSVILKRSTVNVNAVVCENMHFK